MPGVMQRRREPSSSASTAASAAARFPPYAGLENHRAKERTRGGDETVEFPFPDLATVMSTMAAEKQRRRAPPPSVSTAAADDFYSRSARLFAPPLSTAPKASLRPTTAEAWLAARTARTNDTEVTRRVALPMFLVSAAFAPQPCSDYRGWSPMGAHFRFAHTDAEMGIRGSPVRRTTWIPPYRHGAPASYAAFGEVLPSPSQGGDWHHPMALAKDDQSQFAHRNQPLGMGGLDRGHAIPTFPCGNVAGASSYSATAPSVLA